MRYESRLRVAAPARTVWELLADPGGWPGWTPTVTAAEVKGPGPVGGFGTGSAVTLTQPGRRPTTYTVDAFEPGRRFRWSRTAAGVRQWADHVVRPEGADRCEVVLTFAMEGPVGALLGRLGAGTVRRMVDTEGASLKARAEDTAART
ncbi:hypothetical protein RVR_5982 [Actinacidiphila reveromycinica]|uniref:Polyketide cyclase n=1 Tax=Actinacidiphila reveromycinica TaxID=659352 RepID=A0A7U3UV97_9ACTN|nr:SRPBCC family protein [Streptomyces sp. SN-593]BBA99385.1 hypothetical protein RVR_5982 [Streptomyces sp. SN-593]